MPQALKVNLFDTSLNGKQDGQLRNAQFFPRPARGPSTSFGSRPASLKMTACEILRNRYSGLFCFRDRIVDAKKLFDACDFQGREKPLTDSYQGEFVTSLVMRDVGAHQRADSGRVDIRNIRKIDDQCGGILRAKGGLKLKQRSENDRALETENTLTGLGAVEIFDT